MTKIVSVHSRKGGVGKTTVAYELAWLLNGVLVDLDPEEGGATYDWGYSYEKRVRVPLLDALQQGRTPRPIHGRGRPALVPSHPLLAAVETSADEVARVLRSWADDWETDWVVVDTAPGSNPWSDGANAAADLVLVPFSIKTKELRAVASIVKEMAGYPLVLVPNMIPRVPEAVGVARLTSLVEGTSVRVGPIIPRAEAVSHRRKRMAMSAESPPAQAVQPVVDALKVLADYVRSYHR